MTKIYGGFNKSPNTVKVNIEAITADKQLALSSAYHQELTNIADKPLAVIPPDNPVTGLTFLICNSHNSTNDLIVEGINVEPSTFHEIRWMGYWKII